MKEKKELKYIENIPASQLLERIKYDREAVAYEHTNLQNANRSKLDLAELMTSTALYTDPLKPKYPSVQSLITYPIKHMIYFNVIASIETELKIGEEADLYEYVEKIHEKIAEVDYKTIEQDIMSSSSEQAKHIIQNIKSQTTPMDPSLVKYNAIYETIKKNLSEGHYQVSQKFMDFHGIDTKEDALDLLAEMAIQDMIYNERIRHFMQSTVDPKINTVIDRLIADKTLFNIHDEKGEVTGQAPLQKLALYQGEERRTFMLAGAPASGKGTVLAKILFEAKEMYGISGNDMVKINTDTHRLLVSNGHMEKMGPNKELHVSLNNDESSYISTMAYEKMRVKIDSGLAPHMLIDGVTPTEDRIQLGIKNGGKLNVSVLSIVPEQSVERAQNRGDEMGRYVQTAYLLNAHKAVTTEVYKMLCEPRFVGKEPITVSIYDNNVGRGESPSHIAEVDMEHKTADIFDRQKLAEFRGKRTMDPVESSAQFYREALQIRRGSFSSSDLLASSGYTVNEQDNTPEDPVEMSHSI